MTENLKPTDARQGVTGHRVKVVLITSMVLALFTLGAFNYYGESGETSPATETTTQQ